MENQSSFPGVDPNESEPLAGSQPAEKGPVGSSGKTRGSPKVELVGGGISLWPLLFLVSAFVLGVAKLYLRTEVMWITRLPWIQRGFCVSELTPGCKRAEESSESFRLLRW